MAVVSASSFAELKSAVEDASTTEILVTSDITFSSGGIKVNVAKSSTVIDFGNHTVTDNNSSSFTDTIYISSTTNTVSVTAKNAVWSGRNYYGVVSAYDGNTNSTIIFENITYTGPQFSYNKNGVTKISNCSITLSRNGTSTNPQECCEANRLIISGTVDVKSESTSNAVVWFTNTNSALTIEENAKFTVTAPSTYMFYTDSQPNLVCKKGSYCNISTLSGLFYSTGTTSHIFNTAVLEENSTFIASKTNTNSIPMFKCISSLNIGKNATFRLYSSSKGTSSLLYFARASVIKIDSPKSIVLYNNGGVVFNFQTGSTSSPNTLSISTEMLNLWTTATTPLASAGGFSDIPTSTYHKTDYASALSVEATISSSALLTASSNLVEGDTGYPINTTDFKLLSSNVISMGDFPLKLDEINDIIQSISGNTKPSSNIKIDIENSEYIGTSNADGNFSVAIGSKIEVGTLVKVSANNNFLTKTQSYTSVGSVSITSITPLNFYAFTSPNNFSTIRRINSNWSIQITDTRTSGEFWYLYAHIEKPLSSADSTIDNGLVFVEGGKTEILSSTPTLVYTGKWESPPHITTITWSELEGFLLNILTQKEYQKGNYTTQIIWEITTELK